jgi:stage III sporulation protein AF
MAVQMKEEVEDEVINQFGLTVSHVSIEADESIDISTESTEHFSVNVKLLEKVEVGDEVIPAVAEVKIDTKNPVKKTPSDNREKEIISFLAKAWQLGNDQIFVAMEGGGS